MKSHYQQVRWQRGITSVELLQADPNPLWSGRMTVGAGAVIG
jgi:hypothetical protein